jgi:hypothetical protein
MNKKKKDVEKKRKNNKRKKKLKRKKEKTTTPTPAAPPRTRRGLRRQPAKMSTKRHIIFYRRRFVRCSNLAVKRRRHLYLVLDDWEKGYNIYRVVEDDFDSAPYVDTRPADFRPHRGPTPILELLRGPRHQNLGDATT